MLGQRIFQVVQSAASAWQVPLLQSTSPQIEPPAPKRAKLDKSLAKGKSKVGNNARKQDDAFAPHGPMDYKKLPAVLKPFLKPNLNVAQANIALHDAATKHKEELYTHSWSRTRGLVVL